MNFFPTRADFLAPIFPGLLIVALAVILMAVWRCDIARAQVLDNVTITGRVADQNGAVIPGATVTAVFVKPGAERTAGAVDDGRYRLLQLEPGIHNLNA